MSADGVDKREKTQAVSCLDFSDFDLTKNGALGSEAHEVGLQWRGLRGSHGQKGDYVKPLQKVRW